MGSGPLKYTHTHTHTGCAEDLGRGQYRGCVSEEAGGFSEWSKKRCHLCLFFNNEQEAAAAASGFTVELSLPLGN